MLSRRVAAAVDATLVRVATRTLEVKLLAFAAAKLAL
jgi:hypothetical protein